MSVWREEAVTVIALNKNLPWATVMSHCILKCCRVCVCCCVCQCACVQFWKNRGRVSLKCIVDLVKLFPLLSPTLSLSFCSSLLHNADAKWKRQFSLGVFPLMDIVPYPQKVYKFTLVIAFCSATHVSFLSAASI